MRVWIWKGHDCPEHFIMLLIDHGGEYFHGVTYGGWIVEDPSRKTNVSETFWERIA